VIADLLRDGPVVINIGVRDFASSLEAQQVAVIQVDWTPPPALDPAVAALLEELG